MDTSERREIYIPQDAQVGSIPLWTISDRILDRMGVPRPSNNPSSSSSPSLSPEGTWISPVLVRKMSHPAVSGDIDPTGGSPFWAMRKTLADTHGSPVEIPFVTSNRLALEVLRDFLPGARFSNLTSGPRSCIRLPRVAAPPLHHEAVLVYEGNVFLSIRRPKRRRGGEPSSAPPTALSPVFSVPDSTAASIGEPHQTERTLRNSGGLQVPEDTAASHPVPEDPAASHPVPDDPAASHPVPEDSAASHPVPGDPHSPHQDPEEESEDTPSETASAPNTDHPEATSSPQFGDQDHPSVFVPPHEGRLGSAQKNYRDCDFEALALDEKIAQMKAKLVESEAALRRGCS
ncbi:polycystic kidney disease protein 1-like 3 [Gadus chalcogrammus]|uniref:polycystic kidney disease protein 1-like 3 n=1 Tax=Gadus chalcogrammus TaxID=1042646 RepID=UPI0024C2A62D|nr:polycystic kidney disease protein 1-like 3 [Gadus chalcogrammus]